VEDKQYKEYLELTKQYQKQYQKHEWHKNPHEQHHEQTLGNDYSKKFQEKPLVAEEIDRLFWSKLVQLGWRTDNNPLLEGTDSKARTTRFVYVCPECDVPLHAQNVLTVTPSVAKKMCDVTLLQEKLVRHQTIVKDCKAIPEEEAE
jgi:hypothetical protein